MLTCSISVKPLDAWNQWASPSDRRPISRIHRISPPTGRKARRSMHPSYRHDQNTPDESIKVISSEPQSTPNLDSRNWTKLMHDRDWPDTPVRLKWPKRPHSRFQLADNYKSKIVIWSRYDLRRDRCPRDRKLLPLALWIESTVLMQLSMIYEEMNRRSSVLYYNATI